MQPVKPIILGVIFIYTHNVTNVSLVLSFRTVIVPLLNGLVPENDEYFLKEFLIKMKK